MNTILGIKQVEIVADEDQILLMSPVTEHVWNSPVSFNDGPPTDNWLAEWKNQHWFGSDNVDEAGFFAYRTLDNLNQDSPPSEYIGALALVRGFGHTMVYEKVFRSQGMQIEGIITPKGCFSANPWVVPLIPSVEKERSVAGMCKGDTFGYREFYTWVEPMCAEHYKLSLAASPKNKSFSIGDIDSAISSKYGINIFAGVEDMNSYLSENHNYKLGEY